MPLSYQAAEGEDLCNSATKNTKVLLRVYSTDNPNLVEKITLSTNNQNKITDRDLRANDPVQRDIEQIMLNQYGYFYERKNKQFKNIKGPDRRKIIPSPKAAQSYLAIVRAKPANARGYLSSIWSDFYSEIFQNTSVPDLILSYKIYQICHSEARASSKQEDMPQIEKDCRVYGLFHIARAIGKTLVNDQWGHKNREYIKKLSEECETGDILKDNYKIALQLIIELREQSEKIQATPAMYFKNTNSQKELNKRLSSL